MHWIIDNGIVIKEYLKWYNALNKMSLPPDIRPALGQQAAFGNHAEWFASFLRHTDQKRVTLEATLDGLRINFSEIWSRVTNPDYSLDLLYVGAGTGGLEVPLTVQLGQARGTLDNINVYCEDTSSQMLTGFTSAAEVAGIDSVVQGYELAPFESSNYHPSSVDIAVASHAWYYIGKWQDANQPGQENSLAKFADSITQKKGVGLIVLQSNKSDNYVIRSEQSPRIHKLQEHFGEEISKELDNLGIQYQQEVIESHTDVSNCFQDDIFNPTDEGKLLLSFILRASWDEQTPETQQMVNNALTSIVQQNGREEMVFRDLYIWISGKQDETDN